MIGGYHAVATHLRTLMVAVGFGNFDLACTGSFPGAISCEDYKWTVPEDGVVLVYRMEEWPQGPIEPYPTPSVEAEDDHWVEIDGRTALFSQAGDGIMRWDMLGTPEVIEARFGSGASNTAPPEIQAVIDSWHWTTPTATPPPTPIVTGTGSDAYSWQKVGATQAGIFPTWAPGSQHVLIDKQAANEYDKYDLLDRAGQSVANWSGLTDMFWLDSETVEGYESVPPFSARDQYHTEAGRSISATDGTITPVDLPCCDPVSNGHGAFAVTRFLPEQVQDLARPVFVVWEDGVASAEHVGLPIAWDLAGDKLVVLHPSEPNYIEYDGWIEVLNWPALTSAFKDDPSIVISDAYFDPTGKHVWYEYVHPDDLGVWHLEFHVIDIATGSTAKIGLPGDSSKSGVGGAAWNDLDQILVSSEVDQTLSTYTPAGVSVDVAPWTHSMVIQSSANGATVIATRYDNNDDLAGVRILSDGTWHSIDLPLDRIDHISLSPDGTQILVTGYSAADNGPAGYIADIP